MSFAQSAGGERIVEFISAAAHPDARFTSAPPPPPGNWRWAGGLPSYVIMASFQILSISGFMKHTTFRYCRDKLTVSQPDVHRVTCALRFAFS